MTEQHKGTTFGGLMLAQSAAQLLANKTKEKYAVVQFTPYREFNQRYRVELWETTASESLKGNPCDLVIQIIEPEAPP